MSSRSSSSSESGSDSGYSGGGGYSGSGFDSYEANSDLGIPAYHDSDDGEEGKNPMKSSDRGTAQLKCLYVNERFQIPISGKTTVGELRRRLSKEAGHPEELLKLYHHGYGLTDMNQTLSEAKFGTGEPRVYYIYLDGTVSNGFRDGLPDLEQIKRTFDTSGLLDKNDAIDILVQAERLLAAEENVVEVDDPVSVIGDIHGQWFDMAGIMGAAGKFGQRNHVFMGDYVDRGYFSCEVLLYLCAAKICFPNKVFLLRGNHESERISKSYGSQAEFERKYGRRALHEALRVFQAMPVCAVLHSKGKKIMAMHGGLSPDIRKIDEINKLDRFCEPRKGNPLKDFIWADPSKDYMSKRLNLEYDLGALKKHPPEKTPDFNAFSENGGRGGSALYQYAGALAFCEANDLLGIFRGHEQPLSGTGLDQFRYGPKYEFPIVSTVFSAPNYTDTSHNKGTVASITDGKLRYRQYTWAIHPEYYAFDKKTAHHTWFERNMDSEDLIQFLNHFNHDTLRGVPFQTLKGEYIAIFQKVQGHDSAAAEIEHAIKNKGDFKSVPAMPPTKFTPEQLEMIKKEQKKINRKYKNVNLFQESLAKEQAYEQDPDGSTWTDALSTIKARNDMVGTIARNLNAEGAKTAYHRVRSSALAACRS